MFDLIANGHRHTTRRDFAPLVISWAVHALVIGAVALLPLLFATKQLPVPQQVVTYVTVSAPPPPPPPPPAPAPVPGVKRASPRPAPTPRPVPQTPVVAPRELPPSIDMADDGEGANDFGSIDGVAGGVPGGLPGQVFLAASSEAFWMCRYHHLRHALRRERQSGPAGRFTHRRS